MVAGRRFPDQAGAPVEIVEVGAAREDVRHVRPIVGSEGIMSVPVPGSLQVPATVRAICLPGGQHQNCAVNGTVVSPGATRTPIWNGAAPTAEAFAVLDQRISRTIALGRLGEAKDIARTVLFLASDDASYLQGAEIFVDGGATASPAGAPIYRG